MARSVLFLLLLFAAQCHAQDAVSPKTNFIGINPISLLLGGIVVNYEHAFAVKHGVFVEGQYSVPIFETLYGGEIGYRYHFNSAEKGAFVGPFIKYNYLKSKLADENKNNYEYKLSSYSAGINVGNRWKFGKKTGATFRIGGGYPFSSLTWNPTPPDYIGGLKIGLLESIIKITSYLDSELSIAFLF
jgi:hypothetical protein